MEQPLCQLDVILERTFTDAANHFRDRADSLSTFNTAKLLFERAVCKQIYKKGVIMILLWQIFGRL